MTNLIELREIYLLDYKWHCYFLYNLEQAKQVKGSLYPMITFLTAVLSGVRSMQFF